ncbi:MAG: hypothetical protein HQL51_04435 [Magnetococcales bacterium]|nr:hypothetical protein [Magnetococcales bacterium]
MIHQITGRETAEGCAPDPLQIGSQSMKPGRILMVIVAIAVLGAAVQEFAHADRNTLLDGILTWGVLLYLLYRVQRYLSQNNPDGNESPASANNAPQEAMSEAARNGGAGWTVVESGAPVGRFRDHPIPAWIRTSDGREADYAGVTPLTLPEEFTCVEFPGRNELVIPPGIIYAVRH